jgi:dTDP-4-amino-4,6-dideoxygalactose transaminase
MRFLGMTQSTNALYRNVRASTYDIETIGFRYHMANLHAAIGLVQLGKLEEISENRRRACCHYTKHLETISMVRVPNPDFTEITPFMYYIRVPARLRDTLREHLSTKGIETGIHWQPGHWFTLFKGCRRGDLTVSEKVAQQIVSLPLHSRMPVETLDRVIECIFEFFHDPNNS